MDYILSDMITHILLCFSKLYMNHFTHVLYSIAQLGYFKGKSLQNSESDTYWEKNAWELKATKRA